MSAQNPVLFYEMFPFCMGNDKLTADFSGAKVASAEVNRQKMSMTLTITPAMPTPPSEFRVIEDIIAREYGLNSVTISAVYSRAASPAEGKKAQTASAAKEKKKTRSGVPAGSVIMGRRIKDAVTPMEQVTLELGKVTVRGEVCEASSKYIEKSKAWVLSFSLTDYTGTIHVSKFMADENAEKTVKAVEKGMWLTVSGSLSISRFDGDLTLAPVSIERAEHVQRLDTAEEKRVELHMHTKMSALDAVTDTAEIIRRAAQWGHPAIAITDHGVVHSFPDAALAAGDKIKVIYGIEAYFINDLEISTAVYGDFDAPDGRFVVFDVETTGLSPSEDALIEIGAVLVKDGQELDRFSTFVQPGAPIPVDITNLTGIKDEDVKGAPSQKDAVTAFLKFAGDTPLVAQNANFDVGFIYQACHNHAIPFSPRFIDTLAMARCLLPDLRNHKLSTVAAHFGHTDFGHHRAIEDAAATAHVFFNLLELLKKDGVTKIGQINAHLARLHSNNPNAKKDRARNKHIILLAKSRAGLDNLYKLVTISHLENFDKYPIVRKSALAAHRDGLIVGTACEIGEVFDAVTRRKGLFELLRLAEFYDYLEIQPVCNNMFMLGGDKPRAKSAADLRGFNEKVVQLGRLTGKPVVATGDVHFLEPRHEIFRRILLTSKGFKGANDSLPIYFKTTDEMLEEFKYLGGDVAYEVVVANTRKIADMCQTINPLPPKKTLYTPRLSGSAGELRDLVYDKLAGLYGGDPPEIVTRRVNDELGDILDRNYDVIYMAAQKLVGESMRHGYLVGSRGSVGSSLIAYLAGVTEVNALPPHYRCPNCQNSDFEQGAGWGCGADMPDADCPVCGSMYAKDGFNIPFETFLGFGGDKIPDIDLNFSGEFQASAHKFTAELFGQDNVYRAGTITTIASETAYGLVKKYLESIGKTVTKAEENRLSRGCIGVKSTTGQHPGGLIIIPHGMEITDFCPAQRPADKTNAEVITTHFDYHCLEDNLIKLDALGHDDPTMIKMLEDMTGVNATEIGLDDPDTMAIFTSPAPLGLPEDDEIIGATGAIGIPEFGTGFTRQMLTDTKPKNFDTLVRLSGFSHGTDVWLSNAKDLIVSGTATVKETISCRDDIMLYLISKGLGDLYAFGISENVRKGKGLPDGAQEEMARCGIPGWYIDSCNKIKYLFPKAHAVAYVMMAFRIAWFKVHRPLEFYSAYFYRRSQNDAFDSQLMTRGIGVAQAKLREIRNNAEAKGKENKMATTLEACYEFYLRGFDFVDLDLYESDPTKFLIVGEKKLRPPLIAVSGLGDIAAYDIAENRTGREFVSIEDLSAACTKVSKAHLEQLKSLGALRNLPETSQMSLF